MKQKKPHRNVTSPSYTDTLWLTNQILCVRQAFSPEATHLKYLAYNKQIMGQADEIRLASDVPTKVGVISDSYKISDSIPRICRNDTSKLAPSLNARHDPRLTEQSRVSLTGALK
jgi:shikimate kinase